MFKLSQCAKVLLLLLAAASVTAAAEVNGELEESVAEFNAYYDPIHPPKRSEMPVASEISSRFSDVTNHLTAQTLANVSDAQLRNLFLLADDVAFYTLKKQDVNSLRKIHDELRERGLANFSDSRRLYDALLQIRDFDDAHELESDIGGNLGQRVPLIDDRTVETVPDTAKRLIVEGDRLVVDVAPIDKGKHVVVIAHPSCAFSRRAMDAIEKDEELKVAMEGSYWLAPQDRTLGLDAIRDWNAQADVTKLDLMYNQWNWPLLSARSTPTFYLLNNGVIVKMVKGWPQKGARAQLLSALTALEAAE